MSKLSTDTRLPAPDRADWAKNMVFELKRIFQAIAFQVNAVSEGRISGSYNAMAAAPTQGTYARGDVIRNSEPTEAGTGGNKYIVYGWICTVSSNTAIPGDPGTWLPMRMLTGN